MFFWDEIMAGALIASIPVAIAYNSFLDRFIGGITGGAVK
jgi:multiple sugar transport system permease protein